MKDEEKNSDNAEPIAEADAGASALPPTAPEQQEQEEATAVEAAEAESAAVEAIEGEIVEEEEEEEAAAEAELEALRAELEAARAQAADYLDGWQRARAEFANLKKRTERQLLEARPRAVDEFTLRLLPALDDFDLAIASLDGELEEHPWVEGVQQIYRKFQTLLEAEGITEIQAQGEPFDPTRHEAIGQVESEEVPSVHVVSVQRKGYQRGDVVLRPALVFVAV